MSSIGLCNVFVNWIRSYLTNRIQYVVINGYQSKPITVYSGVPQGSHLGPLLFNIFINDIVKVVKYSKCLLYADDLKLFKIISGIHDITCLQEDIDNITSWCNRNNLKLNINKCQVMTFTRKKSPLLVNYHLNGQELARVYQTKDLGILFLPTLNFKAHTDYIIAKANTVLGLVIRSSKNFKKTSTINTLYTSLVRSILEYGVTVWNNSTLSVNQRIEATQKKYVRYFFKKINWPYDPSLPHWKNLQNLPSYKERCKIVGIESLSNRRDNISVQFICDIVSGRIDSTELLSKINFNTPAHNTRDFKPIYLDNHRTNFIKDAPLSYCSNKFNINFNSFDYNYTKSQIKHNLKNVSLNL